MRRGGEEKISHQREREIFSDSVFKLQNIKVHKDIMTDTSGHDKKMEDLMTSETVRQMVK